MENNAFKSRHQTRAQKDRFFKFAVMIPAGIVVALLVLILAQVVINGARALNVDFFFKEQKPFGEDGRRHCAGDCRHHHAAGNLNCCRIAIFFAGKSLPL